MTKFHKMVANYHIVPQAPLQDRFLENFLTLECKSVTSDLAWAELERVTDKWVPVIGFMARVNKRHRASF
jgi:hypothetical protein